MIDADVLMRMALEEAAKGGFAVRPNPKVGACAQTISGIIVADHHARFGGPHAERALIERCAREGIDLKGATLAVTLEPCNHTGKTPPCTDAILAAGIRRVFVGVADSHVKVRGSGVARLRAAGLEVIENVLRSECEALNFAWLASHRMGRPFVQMKMATSLDGLWTSESGDSKWITGPAARARGYALRRQAQVLVTGARTVEVDDPALTARDANGNLFPEQPRVMVLSRSRTVPLAKLAEHPGGAQSLAVNDLSMFLAEVYKQDVQEVLVEAGPTLSAEFLRANLVDELAVFIAPKLLGGDGHRLKAFTDGRLPGLEFGLHSLEMLSDNNLFIRYRKTNF